MKKLLGISFLLIYLLGTTGLAVASHFCCNKLASVDLVLTPKVKVLPAHASCNKDCCRDNVRFYKVQVDQNVAVNGISLKAPVLHLLPAAFFPGLLSLSILPVST